MWGYRVGRWLLTASLALALAGCSGNDTGGFFQESTPVPRQVPTSAPRPQATTQPAATEPAAGAAAVQPVAQDVTPLPEDVQQLDAEEQLVANVYERVAPAVVRITTGQGLGSGFLINSEGYIVTNNHVIADSDGQVRVSFSGLFDVIGQVVGTDPDSDIGVVKVDELPEGVVPVELGDSNEVRIGQRTVAIGNPLGQDRTVTTGIVSAVGRTIEEETSAYSIGGAIQTDAAINPGNSGGPLLNSRGQVIGMNTAILSQSGTSSGIGFAVPVNLIKKVAPALIERGRYDHPYIGARLGEVTTLEARAQGFPSPGVLIMPDPNAGAGSPVYQAGLRGEAILTAINETPMTSSSAVIEYLELNTSPGDTIKMTLVGDNGEPVELQVELGARPSVEDRFQEP